LAFLLLRSIEVMLMSERGFGAGGAALLLMMAAAQCLTCATPTPAQSDKPSWNEPKPKQKPSEPKPTPKPQVHRRPRPTPRPPVVVRPPVPKVPLLTVQYRIFKVEGNGSQIEVNPVTIFNSGDRIRFGFKTSEDGYLTIIRQSDPNQPGWMLFPDSRVNSGQNFVRRGQEFTVPSACVRGTPSVECTYTVNADSAQDFYTIIFSRDSTPNLPDDALQPDGNVRAQSLRQYWTTSGQKLSEPQRGETVFSQRLSNLNPRADSELIIRYFLNKRGRAITRPGDR
jgi:hypothetical protein